jgi:acetolactate decarboxylase
MTVDEDNRATRHTIFQASLITALLDGVYEGDMTVSELLTHGDFGLGTFNSLDGEMLILDSVCYRLRAGGAVSRAAADAGVPFALVTSFVPDIRFDLPGSMSRADLAEYLVAHSLSANYLYAARITGHFEMVTFRNVAKQERPFRPLADVTDGEPVNRLDSVNGVMAGFQTPAYERGIGVPGGHLHFISDDRRSGGHVLDFEAVDLKVELCVGTDLLLSLPTTREFQQADLDPEDLDQKVTSAENHD